MRSSSALSKCLGTELEYKKPLTVTLVYSPQPRVVTEIVLAVEEGCTVGGALARSGLLADLTIASKQEMAVGVWGRKAPLEQTLRANDRIELTRPLTVDPKVARRERFVRQGAKSAGLFATRRAGAKAGY
jgi:putative ubiquitin-RnfH superfamily antitoxin RatB of RatAB toxin-antitoxin module